VHRYRTTRPWSVSALAVAAAACAVLTTGGFSAAFDATEAIGPYVARTLESAGFVTEAHAEAAPLPVRTVRQAAPAAEAAGWQIQVGALRRAAAAEELLRSIAREDSDLADLRRETKAGGAVTRARFAGIADESAALDLCAKLSRRGRECFVVPPGG
jgi:cell division septation protein DedD